MFSIKCSYWHEAATKAVSERRGRLRDRQPRQPVAVRHGAAAAVSGPGRPPVAPGGTRDVPAAATAAQQTAVEVQPELSAEQVER